jgi:hypothetical protein
MLKEKEPRKRAKIGAALGLSAFVAGSGIVLNNTEIAVGQDSSQETSSEILISENEIENINFVVDTLVDKTSSPEFFIEFQDNLQHDQSNHFLVSEQYTGENNFFPNQLTYDYFPNGVSNLDITIPTLGIMLTDPDGGEFLTSRADVFMRVGSDGTIEGLNSDLQIPPVGTFSQEEQIALVEKYFTQAGGVGNINWEENPGDNSFPEQIFRQSVDQSGITFEEVAQSDGNIGAGFSYPLTNS